MSGHNVPYQLRTNKFVERQLFLDLLEFVRVWNGPTEYVYASMGGRFLEDFKLVNDRLAIEHMISIEFDEPTWRRQMFNRPFGFLDCRKVKSREFIQDFDGLVTSHPGKNFIVWLDYAAANKRGEQLQEYEQLVSQLATGDVAKITLNANPQSLRRRADFNYEKDYHKHVIGALQDDLGDYVTEGGITSEQLKPLEFARFLATTVKASALKGNTDTGLSMCPLAAFRYRDGEHQMLTVTAIMADEELESRIDGDATFTDCPFRSSEWNEVREVNVPDLSTKERVLINSLVGEMPDDKAIHEKLPFRLADKDRESLELLENYISHYRRYPSFGRVLS